MNLPANKEIVLAPTHEGIARELQRVYPYRDDSGRFEQSMFHTWIETAKVADKYNEIVTKCIVCMHYRLFHEEEDNCAYSDENGYPCECESFVDPKLVDGR